MTSSRNISSPVKQRNQMTSQAKMIFLVVLIAIISTHCPLVVDGQTNDSDIYTTDSYSAPITSGSSARLLRIGFISSEIVPPLRGAAINLALRQGQADGLLPGYTFSIVYNTTASTCDPKTGVFVAINLLGVRDVDVLFGPQCSPICVANGYVSSYYNVPHFPEYCGESSMDDKATYDTLVRIGGSWRGMGTAFAYILRNYGWRRLILLTNTASTQCFNGATAINLEMLSTPNMTYTWVRMVDSPTQGNIIDYLNQVKAYSRVVVICHSVSSVQQQILFAAQDMNLTNGDYAWFTFSNTVTATTATPWSSYNMTGQDINYRKKLFYALKIVNYVDFSGTNATDFLTQVRLASIEAPWNANFTVQPSTWAAWLYDAVYLYMTVADRMLRSGYTTDDILNGRLVYKQAINTQFRGMTGNVLIDTNGDRICTYTVWAFGPDQQQFYRYMQIDLTKQNEPGSQVVNAFAPVTWGIFGSAVPPDTPACGLQNENCPPPDNTSRLIIGCSIGGCLLLVLASIAQIMRSRMAEAKIQQMLWKIDYGELVFSSGTASTFSRILGSRVDVSMTSLPADDKMSNGFNSSNRKIARYRGNPVSVYLVEKAELNLTRRDLVALVKLKEMNHDNIKTFVGACVEPGRVCYVMNLCSRGSVQDVVEDDNIKLDWMFRLSLISDLINGMVYIHKSMFQSHGRLTSAQCHIDSRWVLKIGGFGLELFNENANMAQIGDHAYYREQLWTAPELLRMKRRPYSGTQKGDVYSFAIVVQEIAYRAQPYFCEDTGPRVVIEKVMNDSPPYYRPVPRTEDPEMHPALVKMMQECWQEQPSDRPSFDEIVKTFRQVNGGKKIEIVDNMLQKLEKYADNLEELVRQRTSELEDEKQKTDMLLHRMLPTFIAEELKAGRTVVPQLYPEATIYFSDIVGFTTLSSQSTPMEVVELLNDLYGTFDDTIGRHDVYKVETIGDAYMVVSGLPKPNEGRHICEICNMALDLLSEVSCFVIRHRPNEKLKLRIGLHTGPCAAGVVGHAMPRYCLFGDTVNVASRMESTGEALRIHMSENAHKAIAVFDEYVTTPRGETFVKGKGMLPTFWLLGKKGAPLIADGNAFER